MAEAARRLNSSAPDLIDNFGMLCATGMLGRIGRRAFARSGACRRDSLRVTTAVRLPDPSR